MLHRHLPALSLAAIATLLLAPAIAAAQEIPPAVAAAVADPARPEADRQRDAGRKPAESIAFAGIKSGDKIAELLPGRGYYTRIFSKVVGPEGIVYAVSPPPRPDAPAGAPNPSAAVSAIAEDPNYGNVRSLTGRVSELKLPELVDVVWTSLNYHDVHNAPNADLKAFNTSVFNALKPGGTYIIIDHAAEKGSGAKHTSTLHRIDPELVKSEVLAVGFELEAESDVLRNPDDPRTVSVRHPSVSGRTDQFLFRFRKPAK
ncbi:MAG TPA: hypothetical protein VIL32_08880 [Steroidobacteraceae bacterium]